MHVFWGHSLQAGCPCFENRCLKTNGILALQQHPRACLGDSVPWAQVCLEPQDIQLGGACYSMQYFEMSFCSPQDCNPKFWELLISQQMIFLNSKFKGEFVGIDYDEELQMNFKNTILLLYFASFQKRMKLTEIALESSCIFVNKSFVGLVSLLWVLLKQYTRAF